MDSRLAVTQTQLDPRRPPEWQVKLDGALIGRIEQVRIGRARHPFFEAVVFLEREPVKLGADADFDGQCDRVLRAHVDPEGILQTRDWLERRRRIEAWRASRGQ
ncbi:hypothetical protein D7252_08905 [Microbacterium sp. CGR2]|nr:hypothetical protein D7252_08905 [Microbacterium sp. CGR2]